MDWAEMTGELKYNLIILYHRKKGLKHTHVHIKNLNLKQMITCNNIIKLNSQDLQVIII